MSLNAKAGVYAVVDGMPSLTNWSVNDLLSRNTFRTSASKAGTGRSSGVGDWNGQMVMLGGNPIVMPGETFTFEGFTGPDSGAPGDTGDTFVGPAIVDSVAITWDYATNAILRNTVAFSGNGPLVPGTGEYADVTNPPASHKPAGLWLRAGAMDAVPATLAADAAAKITHVTTATLTITAQNVARTDSDSDGYVARQRGAIDWTLSVVQNRLQRSLFDKGDVKMLILPINATQYWVLEWGIVGDITGITLDNESNAIVAQTVLFEMFGHDATEGVGSITKPAGVAAWWPYAEA